MEGWSRETEILCELQLKAQGWSVLRRGWPDFFCWKDDEVRVVEAKKKPSEHLKVEQALILGALAIVGIPAFRWTREEGFVRIARAAPSLDQLNQEPLLNWVEVDGLVNGDERGNWEIMCPGPVN